jgi:hypothetical protein
MFAFSSDGIHARPGPQEYDPLSQMARFVRGQQDNEPAEGGVSLREDHPDLVELVQRYSEPMEPDPESRLTVREQHLVGIVRPKAIRDVAWRKFG